MWVYQASNLPLIFLETVRVFIIFAVFVWMSSVDWKWFSLGELYMFEEKKKFAQCRIWWVQSVFQLCVWRAFCTRFSCWDLLLKFVSSFHCPYSATLLSTAMPNDDIFSQQSSHFPYFHSFHRYRASRSFVDFRILYSLWNVLCHSST
jgi:hypothetical protein